MNNFNIIKQLGPAQSAKITAYNWKLKRMVEFTAFRKTEGLLEVEGFVSSLVPLEDYGDHFIFKLPKFVEGPTWLCTCGSRAIHNLDANVIVCYDYATLGHHQNLIEKWV